MKTKFSILHFLFYLIICLAASYFVALGYSLHLQGYRLAPTFISPILSQANVIELSALNSTLMFSQMLVLLIVAVLFLRPLGVVRDIRKETYAFEVAIIFFGLLAFCSSFIAPKQIETFVKNSVAESKLEKQKADMFWGRGCVVEKDTMNNTEKTVCIYEYSQSAHAKALLENKKKEMVSLHDNAILDLSNVPLRDLTIIFGVVMFVFRGCLRRHKKIDIRSREN